MNTNTSQYSKTSHAPKQFNLVYVPRQKWSPSIKSDLEVHFPHTIYALKRASLKNPDFLRLPCTVVEDVYLGGI